jgi:hypothetical protein
MVSQRTSTDPFTTAADSVFQNLNYNVPGGKLNRGMSVVDSVKIFKGRELTEDEYFHAALVGWCVELVSIYQPALSLQQLTIHYL